LGIRDQGFRIRDQGFRIRDQGLGIRHAAPTNARGRLSVKGSEVMRNEQIRQ
jgi:hypothetical protein